MIAFIKEHLDGMLILGIVGNKQIRTVSDEDALLVIDLVLFPKLCRIFIIPSASVSRHRCPGLISRDNPDHRAYCVNNGSFY